MYQIQQLLQQAFQALSSGKLAEGNTLANKALHLAPQNADVLHMVALARKANGFVDEAIQYFEKTLTIQYNQPQVIQNYLNYLRSLNRHDAIVALLTKATKTWPQNAQLYVFLGMSLKELKRYDEALTAYDSALILTPNDTVTLHNKGVVLRMRQQPDEALKCYDQIIKGSEHIPELRFNRGCAYYDMGEVGLAEKEFQETIKLRPDYVEAHESLNKIYWEHKKTDEFMSSYQQALKQADSESIRLSHIGQLLKTDCHDEAKESLDQAMAKFGQLPGLVHAQGAMLALDGDYDSAIDWTSKAITALPHVSRFRIDMANYYIHKQDYTKALDHLAYGEMAEPDNQELWAYKGICWRLLGDDKEQWLNNYDLLVQGQTLDVPDGYDNLEDFMDQLGQKIESFHLTDQHPLDQSLRNGTQTSFFLLDHDSKVIQDYKWSLDRAVQQYLSKMPNDQNHPFLRHLSQGRGFTYSGSWSVRLKSEGYHVNHVHPEGWLSGPSYINVPSEIHEADPNRAGWVKFGETGLNLGSDIEKVAKAVCPKKGLVVFFPSYMWHGTFPFESDQFRVTAPIDVMPA